MTSQTQDRPFRRGFLPDPDPPQHLPPACREWESLGRELPKLLLTPHLRPTVAAMPPFPIAVLDSEPLRWRAATLLAYITSLYVLGLDGPPARTLPAVVARPFWHIAQQLGIPPILSYALQAMWNWRRVDPQGPIAAGNLTLLNNFLGGVDEEWFVTLHIEIEAAAAPAIRALAPAQAAALAGDGDALIQHLATVATTVDQLIAILNRMPDRCDPYIYYHRVRPFMFGWKDNPALPGGLLYDGVSGTAQQFRGETGAQSAIIPAIDAALGIEHERDEMRRYLLEMRDYMPPRDRAFIAHLAQARSVRDSVKRVFDSAVDVTHAFNAAIDAVTRFRRRHIAMAAEYILAPAKDTAAVGTGGTPFTFYLRKHIRETEQHRL